MHIKKHLSFSSLRKLLSECFCRIPEYRQDTKVSYSIHDALMSGFACMYFQDSSILQFQERMQETHHRNNLSSLFGVKEIPKDNHLRNIVDEIASKKMEYSVEE